MAMNEPAFPRPASEAHSHGMHSPQTGMTLRDYFAAKAMHAILSDPNFAEDDSMLAKFAYNVADSMMEARK
jgi:hypothetical protein